MISYDSLTITPVWELTLRAVNDEGREASVTHRLLAEPTAQDAAVHQDEMSAILRAHLED